MEVVKAAYPDPAQYEPCSDGYDPKSTPEQPRWYTVDVRLTRKFTHVVPLSVLKQQPSLAEMTLFKQGRLSVTPVTKAEWKAVMALAD